MGCEVNMITRLGCGNPVEKWSTHAILLTSVSYFVKVVRCQWNNGHARQWSTGMDNFLFYNLVLVLCDTSLRMSACNKTPPPDLHITLLIFLLWHSEFCRPLWLVKQKQPLSLGDIGIQIYAQWSYGIYLVLLLFIIRQKRILKINFCVLLTPLLLSLRKGNFQLLRASHIRTTSTNM